MKRNTESGRKEEEEREREMNENSIVNFESKRLFDESLCMHVQVEKFKGGKFMFQC